jgi:hypothetical protein
MYTQKRKLLTLNKTGTSARRFQKLPIKYEASKTISFAFPSAYCAFVCSNLHRIRRRRVIEARKLRTVSKMWNLVLGELENNCPEKYS